MYGRAPQTGRSLTTEILPVTIDDNVPMPRLLDVPAVCALTTLSVSRIYALIAEGELRRVKIGRKALFVEAEIRAWLEAKIAASPAREAEAA